MDRFLVVALCAAVGLFYVWTVRSSGDPWKFGSEQRDYYNLLIDGYLDGQLHLKVEVPEALRQLKDPYDPAQRPPELGLHDASYYQGRYYVYFGVAPMVVLMLPFRLIAGIDLPLAVAVLVYVYGGFLASAAILLAVRRRYFPEARSLAVLLGVAVMGFGGVGPVLLRRPHMWELPIGGGACFAMLCLACLWAGLHARRGRVAWLAAAAGCLGLAIASRPTYLVAAPLLGAPLFWCWRADRRAGGARWPWREALGVFLPLAAIGGAMAWHNAARFGDPLQFGQAYQLSLDYESKLPHFSPAYVPYNLRTHFLIASEWSPYFPFIEPGRRGPSPPGFTIHHGDVHGILPSYPIVLLVALVPLALRGRSPAERGPLGAWLAAAGVLAGSATLLLLSFFSALARYQMDFLPVLLLLGGIGWLAFERSLRDVGSSAWRGVVRTLVGITAVYSGVFGFLFSLQFDRLLGERNPLLEREVARILNWVPALLEHVSDYEHGPVEITLRLPAARPPGNETLFTCGRPPRQDRVFVRYREDGRVQFGLTSPESPELISRPLLLAPEVPHRLVAGFGSLYPPDTHPFFAGVAAAEVQRVARQTFLEVDGETVVWGWRRTQGVALGRVLFEDEAYIAPGFPRFRGETVSIRRLGHDVPPVGRSPDTFVRLRLAFNPGGEWTAEPVATFGAGLAAALLSVHRHDAHQVRLGLSVGEAAPVFSDPLPLTATSAPREIVVTSAIGGTPRVRRFHVFVDGALFWAQDAVGPAEPAPAVVVGKNAAARAGFAPEFGGQIHSAQIGAGGRDPLGGPGDRLRLRLRLPVGKSGGREPLVVTGRTGAGDLLLVEYVDAETVRFALDHWGAPLRVGPAWRLDRTRPHDVEIAMTSVATVGDATREPNVRAGRVRVQIGGELRWEQAAEFSPAEPPEVMVGRNPIGATTCDTMFSGEILAAERIVRE